MRRFKTSYHRCTGTPLHLTLGNHDDRKRLLDALSPPRDPAVEGKAVSRLMIDGVQWLFLDSLETVNAVRGSLGPAQRAWLIRRLDEDPQIPAIVCVHHNPGPSLIGLKDSDEFLQIVTPRRQVKLVLFGHTHRFDYWQRDGLHFLNLPAVGYPFNPSAALGWLSASFRPGGMRFEFHGVTPRAAGHGETRQLWRRGAP